MVDTAELALFHAIVSFSCKALQSFAQANNEAANLRSCTDQLLMICKSEGVPVSRGVGNVMISTINSTLESDYRSRRPPQITDQALDILYNTVQLLHSYGVVSSIQLNCEWFNKKTNRIFIFPGQPRVASWEFFHGKLASLSSPIPKHILPLEYLQHVVHNVDNALTMLRTIPGKVHFKGFLNDDFRGYPLCWFAPVAPGCSNNSRPSCDSLDPAGSRYGCFRFTIPFHVVHQRFPTCFILGTRKYRTEHCHSILLTDSRTQHITLNDKLLPVKLTDIPMVKQSSEWSSEPSLSWLCYHDDRNKKWDQLEFAVATRELRFDPDVDNIRLDFVDHNGKICVPSCKTASNCQHAWDRRTAMRNFLTKLDENQIDLYDLIEIFSGDVWNELLTMREDLRAKRLKISI